MNQLIANVRTAVVVKIRPIAAVAVNNEKFITEKIFYTINYLPLLNLY